MCLRGQHVNVADLIHTYTVTMVDMMRLEILFLLCARLDRTSAALFFSITHCSHNYKLLVPPLQFRTLSFPFSRAYRRSFLSARVFLYSLRTKCRALRHEHKRRCNKIVYFNNLTLTVCLF